MFKKYLRIQPASVQFIIFLSLWSLLFFLGQFLILTYFKTFLGVSLNEQNENVIYQYPNAIFITNALSSIVIFLLPALLYAYLANPEPIKYLGGTKPKKNIQIFWVILLAVCLIFVVSPLGTWLKEIDLGSTSKALDEQRDGIINSYLASGNAWATIRSIFLIAVIPAFCEELFFRGILMKFAQTFFKKWWLSIGMSALVFAIFHTSISEFVPIFVAGIILGLVYYFTSSIWLNILLHLLFNGIQVLISMYSNPAVDKSLNQNATLIILFLVASAVVGVCLYCLNKIKTPLPADWSVVEIEPETAELEIKS